MGSGARGASGSGRWLPWSESLAPVRIIWRTSDLVRPNELDLHLGGVRLGAVVVDNDLPKGGSGIPCLVAARAVAVQGLGYVIRLGFSLNWFHQRRLPVRPQTSPSPGADGHARSRC